MAISISQLGPVSLSLASPLWHTHQGSDRPWNFTCREILSMWNILVGASGVLTILYLLGPQGFGADGQATPPTCLCGQLFFGGNLYCLYR